MNENCTKPARVLSWLLPALVALLLHTSAVAQNGKRVAVGRAAGKITLDGALDESDWAQAPALGEILQREPKQEAAATERTEVKLLADKDNLYIGVTCYDSEPEKVVGAQMARDAELEIDDSVAILLDTFHDRRNAFYFATNPAGALVDGLIVENQRGINFNWNAIWNVRVKRAAQGWNAEFAIPFKSLSFNPGQDVWGFNFSRVAWTWNSLRSRKPGKSRASPRSSRGADSTCARSPSGVGFGMSAATAALKAMWAATSSTISRRGCG